MFPKLVISLKPAFLMTFYHENMGKSGFNKGPEPEEIH